MGTTISGPAKVAFVGCGRMGSEIATRLHGAAHHVRCYDRSAEALGRLAAAGLGTASSLQDACEGAEVVFLCLPDDRAVQETVAGPGGILGFDRLPALVVDATTSTPQCSSRMARLLAERGVDFVDAPVSGGVRGARAGRLTTMAGGRPAAIDAVVPLLETYSAVVQRAGTHGAGNLCKLVNNQLSALAIALTAEALSVGEACGVPPAEVLDALNASGARSRNSRTKFPEEVLTGRFAFGFSLALMVKDLSLGAGIIAGAPLLHLTRELYALALGTLGADADLTEYATFAASWNRAVPAEAGPDGAERRRREDVCGALCGGVRLGLVVGTAEAQFEVESAGADPAAVLAAVNASSGMSAVTEGWDPGAPPGAAAEAARWDGFVAEHGRAVVSPAMRTAAALWAAAQR